MHLNKDEILDRLAERGAVAQFVAFRPDHKGAPIQSYSRLVDAQAGYQFPNLEAAISALLIRASDRTVNVRSFAPEEPRSHTFLYGLSDVDEVAEAVRSFARDGLHTIVNETIDIHDGGVSGVVQGDVVEFAPDDTPRCVEKPGVAQLPFDLGMRLLSTVYGFNPELKPIQGRQEFSIHPVRRGTRATHTLLWEYEESASPTPPAHIAWPNLFSRLVGDKAFGLIIAWLLGFPVPHTTVIPRRIRPFTFGDDSGSYENWIRTCPVEPEPGLFTTARGWLDPYKLLADEDPGGEHIASVLSQQAVNATFSGAMIAGAEELIIEGKAGGGDAFMLGSEPPEELPPSVLSDLRMMYTNLEAKLGPVRCEWAHDGRQAWVLQLHHGGTQSHGNVLVPGTVDRWVRFDVASGLEALRALTASLPEGTGIELEGRVGLTSHMADVVRRQGRPTRMVDAEHR